MSETADRSVFVSQQTREPILGELQRISGTKSEVPAISKEEIHQFKEGAKKSLGGGLTPQIIDALGIGRNSLLILSSFSEEVSLEDPSFTTRIKRLKELLSAKKEFDAAQWDNLSALREIAERLDQMIAKSIEARALQLASCNSFLQKLGEAKTREEREEVVRRYFGIEGVEAGLINAAHSIALRSRREGAESVFSASRRVDLIWGRTVEKEERRYRGEFQQGIEKRKKELREKVENEWEEEVKKSKTRGEKESILEEYKGEVVDLLKEWLRKIPPQFLTRERLEGYINQRAKEYRDPIRRAAFRRMSKILRSAEEALGCLITINENGEIDNIDVDWSNIDTSIMGKLLRSYFGEKKIIEKLKEKDLREKLREGEEDAILEITAAGELMTEEIDLRPALENLAKARLGIELRRDVWYKNLLGLPEWLFNSVRGNNFTVELTDKGIVGAESAILAGLIYAGAKGGEWAAGQLVQEIGRRIAEAQAELSGAYQVAAQLGQTYAAEASRQVLEGVQKEAGNIAAITQRISTLEEIVRNGPARQALVELVKQGFHNGAVPAAIAGAVVSLDRAVGVSRFIRNRFSKKS